MKVEDIPNDIYEALREDYKDELATMNEIDEDELWCMYHSSTNPPPSPPRLTPRNSGRYPWKKLAKGRLERYEN